MIPKVHDGLEMAMARNESGENLEKWKKRMHVFGERLKRFPCSAWKTTWKVGCDDPRRVIHAFKVGLSLTLVSLLCILEPLFKGIGEHAIWAVMTVVLVFEFTAGATLCKGLNRGLGTLLAGLLAFLLDYVANATGQKKKSIFCQILHAVFISGAVFIIGSTATYMRFIPYIKKNYDYGVVIFLLTFNLLTVSSYRDDHVLKMARDRFYTIAIGCAICLFMSLLVFPNWSGEDLHHSTAFKLEGLAKSIEACVNEYFCGEIEVSGDIKSSEGLIFKGYRAVLDSKSTDETLRPYDDIYIFHNLTHLEIHDFGYTVLHVLHVCPKLQILKLCQAFNVATSDGEDDQESWEEPEFVPQCLFSCLTPCIIKDFLGWKNELRLVEYILRNAQNLQTMTIKCESEPLKIESKLSQFLKASATCQLSVFENI